MARSDKNDSNGRLNIATHRELLANRKHIAARLEASQDIAALLMLNPVLALREVGVDLTPEIADHVLRSLRHPPKVDVWRTQLEESLQKELGERARPNDPDWLATTLFTKLALAPVNVADHKPVYVDPLAGDREWIASQRPKVPVFTGTTAEPVHGTTVGVAPDKPTLRRLDLASPVPPLEPASGPPARLSLEELWFYKDASPVARELLELGIIEKSSLSIHSGDSFRKIKSGAPNAFTDWIDSVRFTRR
jgi:hypothetical protein